MLTVRAMPIRRTPRRPSALDSRGFSLVELMIALVLGLIVTAAVIALVVAIIHSNRQTLLSTRLNQELRATLAVMAGDLRRARAVDDPLTVAMMAGGNPFMAINTSATGCPTAQPCCVAYAYASAAGGPWHVLRLDAGRVMLHALAARPASCVAPGGTPVALGSDQVAITGLSISPSTSAADEGLVREFTITITGHLVDGDASLANISRTMSQTVYVRSVGLGI
jgi:prepilin-type N-terminal cleavage/methylation domain-containing protein